MGKLYYYYGTVSSAKTMNLLSSAHSYKTHKKVCCLIKPSVDTRSGRTTISSRCGLSSEADIVIDDGENVHTTLKNSIRNNVIPKPHVLLIDEVQFFTAQQINTLRQITIDFDIPVVCYGLRVDFRNNLFDGSKRLFEIADTIIEVKSICCYCDKKATCNMKHINGEATLDGPTTQIGGDETYKAVCYKCFTKRNRVVEIQ
jgi:thymidine kinase